MMASELPALIQALHRALGEVVDIKVNWSLTDGAPDLNGTTLGAMAIPGWREKHQRLMAIGGRRASAKILVVPHMTKHDLGFMVLRQAAGLPIPHAQRTSQLFETAERVVQVAEAQAASWVGQAE